MKRSGTSVGGVEQGSTEKQARGLRARAAVFACAGWVLAVSGVKLFKGSPSDLPVIVQDFAGGMDIGLKFQLVAAVELSVVLLAFVHPRWGWMLLTGLYSLFVGLLLKMIADGQTSCGCFGGAIKLPPAAMLAIDGACLGVMLATRPWSSLPAAAVRWPLALASLAVAWILPFATFRNVQLPMPGPIAANGAAGAHTTAPPNAAGNPAGPGASNGAAPAPGEVVKGTPAPWRLPEVMPEYQVLNPEKQKWVGKHLKETPLGPLLDVELYPLDATWILYRLTCEHCAKELREIANDPVKSQQLYVLVHIPEPNEQEAKQVDTLPPVHIEALLPALPRGYIGLTPWTLIVEGGIVKSIRGPEEHE